MLRLIVVASLLATGLAVSSPAPAEPAPSGLFVSDDGRYLVDDNGEPFFWLGDTAWELFHRLSRKDALTYLDDRAAKGFTVIQAVALAELSGLTEPTPDGYLPLEDNDPARPLVVDGPDNDYWDHVDFVIDAANARGLVVALLPTWGDKWNLKWGQGPVVFTPDNARKYGDWTGARYRDRSVIFVLGGDRNIENEDHRAIIEAMAAGIEAGTGPDALMSFHPQGGSSSADFFHDADWLDFNMRQNGHRTEYHDFAGTRRDFERSPVKPIIDGEPLYEGHPIKFDAEQFGYSTAADVRRPLYWDLFNGAFGHTYGHHAIWQMSGSATYRINNPLSEWRTALDAPGASQMGHARALLTSRPGWATRVAAPDLVVDGDVATAVPGAGAQRIVATRAADRSWAMIYVPVGRTFRLDLTSMPATDLAAWWFDPRTGTAQPAGHFPGGNSVEITPPDIGEYRDWVLVLDDATRGWAAPGSLN